MHHGGDVDADAVAFDVGDDGVVRDVEHAVLDGDLGTAGRDLGFRHGKYLLEFRIQEIEKIFSKNNELSMGYDLPALSVETAPPAAVAIHFWNTSMAEPAMGPAMWDLKKVNGS